MIIRPPICAHSLSKYTVAPSHNWWANSRVNQAKLSYLTLCQLAEYYYILRFRASARAKMFGTSDDRVSRLAEAIANRETHTATVKDVHHRRIGADGFVLRRDLVATAPLRASGRASHGQWR